MKVLFVSAMPVSELRGGIPLALYLGFDPLTSYLTALLGNLIPIPFVLYTLNFVERFVQRTPLSKLYSKLIERVERRRVAIEKYGYLGLTLFVAIPLPVTGAWTGALLSSILGLDRLKSFLFIALGVAVSGVVVLTSSLGILKVIGYV